MAYLIKQSESNASYSVVYLWCVKSDGSSAATHETGGQPKYSIGGRAASNTSGVLLDIDSASGLYAVSLGASNASVLGQGVVRYSSTTVPNAMAAFEVVAFDPFDATKLGLTSVSTFDSSALSVGLKAVTHSAATVGVGTIAAATYSGVTVGVNNIAAGTYSGATVGINNIAAGSYSGVTIAGVTSGVTLLGGQYSNVSIGGVTLSTTATNLTNNHAKYANGSVWIDSVTGSAGAVSYTNGIQSNPVLTIADAKSIADNLLLKKFYAQARSNVTLVAAMSGYNFSGDNWILALGGQAITNSAFIGARSVTGVSSSAAAASVPLFRDCEFGDVTIPASDLCHCRFSSVATFVGGGNYDIVDCTSVVAGTAAPVFDVNSVVNTNISFRRWSGGITINNIAASTVISIDAISGGTVTLNGADGNVQVRGMVTVVDNRTGTPTLGQNQVLNRTVLATPTNITAGVITRVDSNVSLAAGTWSGVTVGTNNIAAGTYSGVTVGTNNIGPGSYSGVTIAGVTSGVTLLNGSYSGVTISGVNSGVTVLAGGIAAASFAAGAIDATAVASATEDAFADALLARNIAGGSSTGRTVKEALYALRNKVAIDGSVVTVYQVNDTTSAWTASVATVSTNSGLINSIDPQ
jgi:hypothetical protein